MLMGHTDVVPVNVDGWSRDPFGGEIVDGMVWGRGAVDMLNLTATMAVAFRRLGRSGFTPKGTLSTSRSPTRRRSGPGARTGWSSTSCDDVQADYVITESGGFQVPTARDPAPGAWWRRRAPSGRRSRCTARRVTRRSRTAPTTRSSPRPRWCAGSPSTARRPASVTPGGGSSRGSGFPAETREALLDPDRVDEFAEPAARARAHRALVHAHDVRADGRARRHEDERHPGPRRPRGRHPHAAGPDR